MNSAANSTLVVDGEATEKQKKPKRYSWSELLARTFDIQTIGPMLKYVSRLEKAVSENSGSPGLIYTLRLCFEIPILLAP
jgi:hypothetical protein